MGHGYVALFRGINIGRARRVSMVDLRAMLGNLGFGDVRTVLNSGNALFAAEPGERLEIAARIEKAMEVEIGISARVAVVTFDELDQIAEDNPLVGVSTDPSRLVVSVFRDPSVRGILAPLVNRDWTPERMALGENAAYLWCPNGLLESRLLAAVGRVLGDSMTSRNWATIQRLHRLARVRE